MLPPKPNSTSDGGERRLEEPECMFLSLRNFLFVIFLLALKAAAAPEMVKAFFQGEGGYLSMC
jgi:hypothetical protein